MRHDRERKKSVQVEGEGRNKICSTKRMKERRIRLSANTAIQFYDVQDRLGCDRATKAIDWLMKEAKVAIDALDAGHQGDHQEYRVPATTTILSPSETSHLTHKIQQNLNHDQTSSFNNHLSGLIINSCPQEMNLFSASKTPLDFTWNINYNRGEGYAFVSREPYQSTFTPPIAPTISNNNGLLGFCFQQEIQVQEDEKDNLVVVPGHYFPSDTSSVLHYQD